jgi:hypothetical protein
LGNNVAMVDNQTVSPAPRRPKPDAVLMSAVEDARQALTEAVDADEVGAHVESRAEADRVVTHYFEAAHAGYIGWRWAVTVARAPRHKTVTVDEIVLVPGDGSLTAPPWLPWKDRVGKDDLGPGDLVPVLEDDPRLVPGYLNGDEVLDDQSAREVREVTRELGLGRERVLSVEGRDEAAERWFEGTGGPDTPIAEAAPARCASCGFLVRLSGPLATQFGVCANGSSPSDGQAVSYDHGCGAHSDVRLPEVSQHQPTTALPVHDTLTWAPWADADLEIISR